MKHVYKVNRYIDERDAIKLKSHEIDQRPKTAIESVLLFTALLIIYLIVQLIGNGFWEIPISAIGLIVISLIIYRYGYKRIWINYRKASEVKIGYTTIIYPHDHTVLGIGNNKIDANIKYLWLLDFKITNSGKGLKLFDYSNLKLKIATDTDNVIEISCPNVKMTDEIASALDTLMLNDRSLQVDWYKNQSIHKNLGFAPSFEMIAKLERDFPNKNILELMNKLDKIIVESKNLSTTPSFETISKLEVIFPGKNIFELIIELDKIIDKLGDKSSKEIESYLNILHINSVYSRKRMEADAERIKAEAEAEVTAKEMIDFVMGTEVPVEVLSDKEIKARAKADKKAKAQADKRAKAEAKAQAKQKAQEAKRAKANNKSMLNAIAEERVRAQASARATLLRYYDIQLVWYRTGLANGANTNPYASDRVYRGAHFKVYYTGN